MTPRQARRARRIAMAVVAFRLSPAGRHLKGVPMRMLRDRTWVLDHLTAPMGRRFRRMLDRFADDIGSIDSPYAVTHHEQQMHPCPMPWGRCVNIACPVHGKAS